MRHRPRPSRLLLLGMLTLACAAGLHWHVGDQLLLMVTVPLLVGATAYEAIPGERRI